MKLSILAGATSQSVNVFVQDSSKTDGSGLAGLVYNTAGLTAYYSFAGANATATAITLATLATVTTAWASGGFIEIDATNMPGWYRLDLPNAVLASGKGRSVGVHLKGATNMAPCPIEIELTGWDNQNATNGGLADLDAAVSSRLAPTVAGRTLAVDANNKAAATVASGDAVDVAPIATGTAQAGGANTITLAAGASSVNNFYTDCWIRITGGTGAGQVELIVAYDGTTKVATVAPTIWHTQPDATSTYSILPTAGVDVWAFTGDKAPGATAGVPDVNVAYFGNAMGTFSGGMPAVDLQKILARTLTETVGGNIVAAFKKLFDVSAPVLTAASVNQTGDSYARLGAPAGVNVSADIAAIKTDTGNLVSRITSTLFAGITSLAQWLGLLAGKQTGDATALTEIKATGAGAGTYDPTADSLQAVRGRGDAAWTTATSVTVTGTVVLDASQPNYAPAKAGDAMALTTSERTSLAGVVWSTDVSTGYTGGEAGAKLNAAGAAGDPWATDISAGYTGNQAGAKLNSAASAGDPWSTDLPGSYVAGQAGYIVGHYIDAAISTAVDEYIKARIYGAVTANADGSLDFKDVVDGTTVRVRIGPTSPVGGRTVTTFP